MVKQVWPAETVREPLTVHAGGRRLAAERLVPTGAPAGPSLVFLHEGLGSIGQWKDFPAELCGRMGLQGLVYDRWGYGGSEALDRQRDARYLHDEAEIFLPAVLEAVGIDRPILVGHSDGGSIALLFAAAFPTTPLAVVTEAAHVFVEEETLQGIHAAVEAWRTTDLRRRLERYHGGKAESVFSAWANTWLSPPFRAWNIEDMLPRITAPLLVIQGEDDEYGTKAQVEAIARGVRGPVATCLVPGCAHVPHLQARPCVIEAIRRFLEPVLEGAGDR
jgi:pimeloyl-ACP methyl ester carboxylesterase